MCLSGISGETNSFLFCSCFFSHIIYIKPWWDCRGPSTVFTDLWYLWYGDLYSFYRNHHNSRKCLYISLNKQGKNQAQGNNSENFGIEIQKITIKNMPENLYQKSTFTHVCCMHCHNQKNTSYCLLSMLSVCGSVCSHPLSTHIIQTHIIRFDLKILKWQLGFWICSIQRKVLSGALMNCCQFVWIERVLKGLLEMLSELSDKMSDNSDQVWLNTNGKLLRV